MDHLPKIRDPLFPYDDVPYLGGKLPCYVQGFWDYPTTQGWDIEALKYSLHQPGAYMALYRAKRDRSKLNPQEVASLLQAWWYFGMMSEVLGVPVDVTEFAKRKLPNNAMKTTEQLFVTTAKLEQHLQAWRDRLQLLPGDAILERLKHAMKCINQVHEWLEVLAKRIEHHIQHPLKEKPIPPELRHLSSAIRVGANGRVSVADAAFSIIQKHYGAGVTQENAQTEDKVGVQIGRQVVLPIGALESAEAEGWTKYGRLILPEELELSICILGFSLSHAVKSIYLKNSLGPAESMMHPGWYCPEFIKRRMILAGVCQRAICRLQPTLLLIGCYGSSQLRLSSAEPSHAACTDTVCTSDHMADGSYTRRHQENCQSSCQDVLDDNANKQVAIILRSGGIPVLRVLTSASSQKFVLQVSPANSDVPYVAFSHIWSDGLGNPGANTLYECQWLSLQKLANHRYPPNHDGLPVPFWIDTICVPVADPQPENQAMVKEETIRAIAISHMRKTYYDADEVLVLDSHLTSLMSEMTNYEFSLRLSWSKWMRRLWTMHEGAVARPGRTFVKLNDGVTCLKQVVSDLYTFIERDQSAEDTSILGSLGFTEAMTPWAQCLEVRMGLGQHQFMFAWNESKGRGTKYDADRYVVVGSLLQLESQKTLAMATEEKMKFLLRGAGELPPLIIFMGGPKIQEDGWRWAPATLGKESGRIEFIRTMPHATLHPKGLMVNFSGWRLMCHPEWDRRFRWTGKWTRILERSPAQSGRCAWVVEVSSDCKSGQLYTVDIRVEDYPDRHLSASNTFAIVLQPMAENHRNNTRAVLVSLEEEKDKVIYARYEAPLNITVSTAEDIKVLRGMIAAGQVQLIKAERLDSTREGEKWCIK
jgi:hypothetical protein